MINIRALLRGLFTSASSKACDEEITDPQPLKLFVSHSTADAPLAEALVELFRSALNLPAEAIRCTSVEGYRLPGGANVDEQLRSEVNSAKACVGIISRQSIQSPYVLLELGARWGPKLHLLPVLAPGNGPEVLDGHVEREWVPSQRALAIELEPLPDGGAVIFPEATRSCRVDIVHWNRRFEPGSLRQTAIAHDAGTSKSTLRILGVRRGMAGHPNDIASQSPNRYALAGF